MEQRFTELESYLESMASLRTRLNPPELRGTSRYNSLEEAVLQDGHRFRHGRSDDVPRLQVKRCFNNAYDVLLERSDLFYCEGFATSIIPVHHAWLCDERGVVYDPTWWQDYHRDAEDAYCGLVFETEYVLETVLRTGVAGVFYGRDWRANPEILRGDARLMELNCE